MNLDTRKITRNLPTSASIAQRLADDQLSLVPVRLSSRYENACVGRELPFLGITRDGRRFYCKADRDHRNVRATEWICTHLARHLGIETADCAIIEDDDLLTYFGSLEPMSTASDVALSGFLNCPRTNEIGQVDPWLGRYLSGLHAFDMFLGNGDRHPKNFVLTPDGGSGFRLRAIDFASANLNDLATDRFPVEPLRALGVGNLLRKLHGKSQSAALEMVDRIAAVRLDVIERIVRQMPDDWLSSEQKRGLSEVWSNLGNGVRLPALRAGLADESLL